MLQHRWISMINFLWVYCIGLTISLAISSLFWLSELSINTVFIVVDTTICWTALVSFFYFKQHFRPPTYVVEIQGAVDGITVWTNDLPISRDAMSEAIDFFINELSHTIGIDKVSLTYMLAGSTVEWRKTKISMLGLGFFKNDGYQKGKAVLVHWPGSIAKSSLFHEWVHLIDEQWSTINNRPYKPDVNHMKAWWVFLDHVQHAWAQQH